MTLVDLATTSAGERSGDRIRGLQEWALTRASAEAHLHAIELVLAHDFDEPLEGSSSDWQRAAAQRDRESALAEVSGVASVQRTRARAVLRAPAGGEIRARMAA